MISPDYSQNAPYIFTTVWSVIKGWLDPVTVEKIKILGSGYVAELEAHVSDLFLQSVSSSIINVPLDESSHAFLSHFSQIAPENLPSTLGGKCDCPGGCSLSDAGPWNTDEGRKIIEKVREEAKEKKVQHQKEVSASK